MTAHQEKAFESDLCGHLAANGWLYSTSSEGYDKVRALFAEDVFAWLEATQPDALARAVKADGPNPQRERDLLLDRIRKVLDTPHENGGGTLNLLRRGFSHMGAKFDMLELRPETDLNPTSLARYEAVRVRVVRQVYYSTAAKKSIDLVLFVNGIAVATLELKTDFTQTVEDAKAQYRTDRVPGREPLLGGLSGALVHFAVSNSEVWMTTRLAGPKTRFLPFNLGHEGGKGNPANPHGSATAYLWERVLGRDAWLDIIGKFLFVKTERSVDPISGKASKSTSLRFPRLHQWDVVTQLVETSRAEGPGHKYLVQHSAGSGKTDSISWTANRLSRLHDANNDPVFDSVIVVTDRTVLDDQLQKAIGQIEKDPGYVATIDAKTMRDTAETAKSKLLARVLLDGTRIVVVTIQTFPHAMEAIRSAEGLGHKRFAVIADEAHSSQTGETANKLRSVLSTEQADELDESGSVEVDADEILAAEASARAGAANISYYAFTATPKAKTLELFGRPDATGTPVPFHVYSMKQAIEEGYILDVLRGYQTWDTAFEIARNTPGTQMTTDGDLVDSAAATKGLMRWVKLHPTNIGQKVQIIVEHFRTNVAHLLEGHAKAMVVTDSRKAAVRYKKAIDAYIGAHRYPIGTLVAFSGSVKDFETYPDEVTEASLNPGLRGRKLPDAFATDEFQILLVANKYQTGFDQPLLSAMYVDKRLASVSAVQTLSRLNRTYTTPSGVPKTQTLVLDFVNQPEDIQAAFEPYYVDAHLETATDPNLVHDLVAKLDNAPIYTQDEIDACAQVSVGQGSNNALIATVTPAKQRFAVQYQQALANDDHEGVEVLQMFRKDVGTFVRLYDFMSQIVDYGDAELEKRSIFLRLLERTIREDNYSAQVDLSDVSLVNIKQIDRGAVDIRLGADDAGLQGIQTAGTATLHDPQMVAFQQIIDQLNDLFGDEDFTRDQKESFVRGIGQTVQDNETIVRQALANTRNHFLESPDLKDGVLDAVADNQQAHNKMADVFYSEGPIQAEFVEHIGRMVFEAIRQHSA